MKCCYCQKENSPPNARFCVACGYALRQECPHEGCKHQGLPVRAEAPVPKCPACERFFSFCPKCFRLHPLGTRVCSTKRCIIARIRPREVFGWHEGLAGGVPLELTSAWANTPSHIIPPGAQSGSTEARCGALSSRYGLVVWWKAGLLHIWPGPKAGGYWPPGAPVSLDAIEASSDGEIFPSRQAMRLAHGNAYLLSRTQVARLPLGQSEGKMQILALVTRAATEPLEDAGMEFSPIAPMAAPTEVESPTLDWQAHQVEWLAQESISGFWLGLGMVGESPVGVKVRASNALFEGQKWAFPAAVTHSNWRELLVWNDAPVLRTSNAIWREENGVWRQRFELDNESQSLDGAMSDGEHFWVWGHDEKQFWVARLDENGASARASMPFFLGDTLFPFPTAQGTQITFFRGGTHPGACTLDVARPLDDAMRQQLPAASPVVWSSAVSYAPDGAQWLLYAADDGEIVSLYLMEQKPQAVAPFLVAKFRPLRDSSGDFSQPSRGATLAFTICSESLIVSYIGTRKGERGAWLTAHTWNASALPPQN